MKKWFLICCICLLCISINVQAKQRVSEDSKELIVLVDTSGTMRGSKWEREIEWVQQICAAGNDTGIKISFVCFDDSMEAEPEDGSIVNGSDGQQSMRNLERLEEFSPSGKKTDLQSAMEWAIKHMGESNAEYKCIAMLSDGQLDLVGRSSGEYNLDERERDSKERFMSAVTAFNNDENQSVVLVEFDEGNNGMCIDGEPVSIFQDLKEMGIKCFSWTDEANKAIDNIFNELNYISSTTESQSCVEGPITFSVDESYYRVIVRLHNREGTMDMSQDDALKIVYTDTETGETEPIAIDGLLTSKTQAFLYLKKPKMGVYTIDIPKGQWRYSITNQCAVQITAIEVEVRQNGYTAERLEEEEIQYHVYSITAEPFSVLVEMDADMAGKMEESYSSDISIEYCITGVDETSSETLKKEEHSFTRASYSEEGRDCRRIEFSKMEEGEYQVQIRVLSGGVYYCSNPIRLKVKEGISVLEDSLEVKINQEIDLRSYIKDADGNESVEVSNGQGSSLGKIQMNSTLSKHTQFVAEDGKMYFVEEGEFVVVIANDSKEVHLNICVAKEEEKPKCWLEVICNRLKDLFKREKGA